MNSAKPDAILPDVTGTPAASAALRWLADQPHGPRDAVIHPGVLWRLTSSTEEGISAWTPPRWSGYKTTAPRYLSTVLFLTSYRSGGVQSGPGLPTRGPIPAHQARFIPDVGGGGSSPIR